MAFWLTACITLEYAKKPQALQKTKGVKGYSGTRKGLAAKGSVRRSHNKASPTKSKKLQNIGAVNSTIAAKPSASRIPSAIKPTLMQACIT